MSEKVAGVGGGLVSSAAEAGVVQPTTAQGRSRPQKHQQKRSQSSRARAGREQLVAQPEQPKVEEKSGLADEDIYETDAEGNILMDAAGNPIRLPPPVDVEPMFEKLVTSFPVERGKSTSRKERIAKGLSSTNLVYSEVTFEMMRSIVSELKELGFLKRKAGNFFDLGSGLGKAVIAAAMLHPFESCIGIEVLEQLHSSSVELLRQFHGKCGSKLNHLPAVGFVLGDIAEVDWRSASVLFINMTTFTRELIQEIKYSAGQMKRGTICITVTKQLRSKAWEVVHVSEEKLNWGQSQVYIHHKLL